MVQPLAVSMGEPAGIGPDILLAMHRQNLQPARQTSLVVFGDPTLLRSRAARLGLDLSVHSLPPVDETAPQPLHLLPGALNVVDCGTVADQPGTLDPATGKTTVRSLTQALDAVRLGLCRALVTAPIHKANLYASGFEYPGHTEMLEAYAQRYWPRPDHGPMRAVMMLQGPELRTVPVTVHIPLGEVPEALSQDLIVDIARAVAGDLTRRFGLVKPRLAVTGLNPHAGENGALGQDDATTIAPAIKQLKAEGIDAVGPLPADTLFHAEARATFDVALCMYHDQALIPVKALDFHHTVNVTLGLPFVRTSPDHGTALTLAGTGKASAVSMIEAVKLADHLSQRARKAA